MANPFHAFLPPGMAESAVELFNNGYGFDYDFVGQGGSTSLFSATDNAAPWLNSTDNSGTCAVQDAAPGGVVKLAPGTGAGDYVSVQLCGESFKLAVGKNILFGARISIDDADDAKWYAGLCTTAGGTSATIGPVADLTSTANIIAFRNTAGTTTAIHYDVESAGTETTAAATSLLTGSAYVLADGTATTNFVNLTFWIYSNTRVAMFINGDQVADVTTNIPTTASVTPTLEIGSPTGTTATSMFVDRVFCFQAR